MRYVRAIYRPPSGNAFHPAGQGLADADGVTREDFYTISRADDDTFAVLLSIRGDERAAKAALRDEPTVRDVAVAEGSDGAILMYARFECNDFVEAMFRARRRAAVIVDPPMTVRDSGALEVTYLGTDDAFVGAFGDIGDVSVEVLETGRYTPQRRDAFDSLTDRQAVAVEAAVRLGYYQNPREATQADVADAIGCAPGTAGEHLRKAEERVFGQF